MKKSFESLKLTNYAWKILIKENWRANRAKKILHFTTKCEKIAKMEHLVCPKVGGWVTNPLVPPLLKVRGHKPPLPPSLTPLYITTPVANTRFTAPLLRHRKTILATGKWYNFWLHIIPSQKCYPVYEHFGLILEPWKIVHKNYTLLSKLILRCIDSLITSGGWC